MFALHVLDEKTKNISWVDIDSKSDILLTIQEQIGEDFTILETSKLPMNLINDYIGMTRFMKDCDEYGYNVAIICHEHDLSPDDHFGTFYSEHDFAVEFADDMGVQIDDYGTYYDFLSAIKDDYVCFNSAYFYT